MKSHRREPFETQGNHTLIVKPVAAHLVEGHDVLVDDHWFSAQQQGNTAARSCVAQVPAVSEIAFYEFVDRGGARDIWRSYVSLQQERSGRPDRLANPIHQVRPSGRIQHHLTEAGSDAREAI
jgi:hypothetical protein